MRVLLLFYVFTLSDMNLFPIDFFINSIYTTDTYTQKMKNLNLFFFLYFNFQT